MKKLANSSFKEAERNNRTTVQPKDISMFSYDSHSAYPAPDHEKVTIVNRSDEFFFLEGKFSCISSPYNSSQ